MRNIKYNEKSCSRFLFIASMSSGKSTLINALIGKKILRTSNFACTSRELQVVVNNRLKDTRIYLEQENGTDIVLRNIDANKDKSLINDAMECSCKRMLIETCSVSTIVSSKPIVLIDTPGENYSRNNEHEIVTRNALKAFDNGIIIYVLNATQIGTEDDFKILSELKSYMIGKDVKVLFVLNKVDELDNEKEKLNEFISEAVVPFINKVNINDYVLIPCASEAALLFKLARNESVLSEAESDKLYKYYKHYYKDNNGVCHTIYASDAGRKPLKVIYDEEQYDVSNIGVALRNTGIFELERYISKVSTQTKTINIKTKEKK